HANVVEMLLEYPLVDHSLWNNDPIRFALGRGHVEIAKLLLKDPRVDATASDNEAICKVCEYGHLKLAKLFLSHSKQVGSSERMNRPLDIAIQNGRAKIVELLLRDSRVNPGIK
ncbi:hypothetical protein BDR26DRAFT_776795, partial [Obelidium mucronatum]